MAGVTVGPADLRNGADGGRLPSNHGTPATVSASKRPSTSSLRRFITSRPYVTIAELRRRFGLDEPDAMTHLQRNGTSAWIGLPDREATKLEDLWHRDELGLQLSVEVRAPVVVGIYPMRIARYVMDSAHGNGSPAPRSSNGNGANGVHADIPTPSEHGESRNAPTFSNSDRQPVPMRPHGPRPTPKDSTFRPHAEG